MNLAFGEMILYTITLMQYYIFSIISSEFNVLSYYSIFQNTCDLSHFRWTLENNQAQCATIWSWFRMHPEEHEPRINTWPK